MYVFCDYCCFVDMQWAEKKYFNFCRPTAGRRRATSSSISNGYSFLCTCCKNNSRWLCHRRHCQFNDKIITIIKILMQNNSEMFQINKKNAHYFINTTFRIQNGGFSIHFHRGNAKYSKNCTHCLCYHFFPLLFCFSFLLCVF